MKEIRIILALPFFILSALFGGIYEAVSGEHGSINYTEPKE